MSSLCSGEKSPVDEEPIQLEDIAERDKGGLLG
jgi:hypothetical protein